MNGLCTTENREGPPRYDAGRLGQSIILAVLCAALQACGGEGSSEQKEADSGAAGRGGSAVEAGAPDVQPDWGVPEANLLNQDAQTDSTEPSPNEHRDAALDADSAFPNTSDAAIQDTGPTNEAGEGAEGGGEILHEAGREAGPDAPLSAPDAGEPHDASSPDSSQPPDCSLHLAGPRGPTAGRSEAFHGTEADYLALGSLDCDVNQPATCSAACLTAGGSTDSCSHAYCSSVTGKCAPPTYWQQISGALTESTCADPLSCSAYVTTISIGSPGSYTDALQLAGFGFDVPAQAAVRGIRFEVRRMSNAGCPFDASVRLVKNGSEVGSDHARSTTWSESTLEYVTYGGEADLWGASWTAADISSSGFGISIRAICPSTTDQAIIDYVRATVYFVPAGCP